MPNRPMTDDVTQAIQEMHPDPFIQAAVWRLYEEAPGLLDSAAYVIIAQADGLTIEQMMDTMTRHPRVTTTTQED